MRFVSRVSSIFFLVLRSESKICVFHVFCVFGVFGVFGVFEINLKRNNKETNDKYNFIKRINKYQL